MRFSQISALLFAVGVIAAPGLRKQERGLDISDDGKCGGSSGKTCLHSFLGNCCSKDGFCGTTATFCGVGCQSSYGKCTPTFEGKLISQDGTCGSDVTCQGSKFGSCCSQYGYCGKSSDYCGEGCDSDHGSCSKGSFGDYKLKTRGVNPTCPSSNNTIYTTEAGTQYQIQCYMDHAGGDLKMVYVNSNKIADCLAQCESTTGCQAIAMSGTACYMKSTIGAPVKNSAVRGAVFVGTVSSSSASSTSSSAASSTFSSSADSVTGSSSSSSTVSSSSTSNDNPSSTSGFTTALPTSTSPTCPSSNNTVFIASSGATFLIECYVDHAGGDMKMVYVNSNRIADCIAQCDATDGCIDISMSGTACYMKNKLGAAVSNGAVRGARMIKAAPSSSSSSSVSSTSSSISSASSTTDVSSSISSSVASSSSSSSSSAAPSTSSAESSSAASSTESSASSSSSSSTESSSTASSTESSAASSSTQSSATSSTTESSVSSSSSSTASSTDSSSSVSSSTVSPTATSSSSVSTGTKIVTVTANSTIGSSFISSSVILSTGVSSLNATSSQIKTNSTVASTTKATVPAGVFSPATSSTSSSSSFSSVVLSTGVPLSTGLSGTGSGSTSTGGSPYGNGTSTASTAGPTVPLGSGVSSSSAVSSSSVSSFNGTTSISSTGIVTAPISTGVSLSTGISGTASASTSTDGGAPYGNGTSSTVSQPTGASGSIPLVTGVSSSSTSSFSITANSSASLTTSFNLTGSISSTVMTTSSNSSTSLASATGFNQTSSVFSTSTTLSSNSSVSVPLTTAPIATGVSGGISVSSSTTGRFANFSSEVSSSSAATTTAAAYAFPGYGGISSGHPMATNTTACSTKPTSTAVCTPCEGQPGDDEFCGYTAYDNSYDVMPITCNTVEYSLDLTECEVAPDGVPRSALCINGQTPGPLLTANWGDTVIVHVTNSMTLNGSSIHWHGIRQNYTNEQDGVVGITQCALAPGQTQTYTWKATNYGNSWYHSHLTLQAYEGLFGPMLIRGPTTADYDEDAGQLTIQDWSHIPVDAMYHDAEVNGVRTLDTGLINGMNINPSSTTNVTGQRYTVPTEFVPGKKYLFHLLNSAIQSTYKFYIDGHKMTVISADFVPIVPYETEVLNINIGQRYQVIVEADQAVGDYFLRFDNQNACASTINSDDIRGIIHYSGSAGITPNSTAYTYTRKDNGAGGILGTCEDEPLASLVPAAPMDVGPSSQTVSHDVVVSNSNAIQLYRWYLDGTTFQTSWSDPTLYSVVNNDTIPDYSGNLAIETTLGEWTYIVIESPIPLGHPIHLHGHDFHILARGYGTYDSSVELNLVNPPRRDVAFMPGDGPTGQGGFLVLAFFSDNPGVWLMHCHIGWHVAMGFALQFIEGKELIKDTVSDTCLLNDVCDTWRPWAEEHGIHTDDSGV